MPAPRRFSPPPSAVDPALFKVAIMISLALHLLLLVLLSGWLPGGIPVVNLPISALRVTLLNTPPGKAPAQARLLAQHDSQGQLQQTRLDAPQNSAEAALAPPPVPARQNAKLTSPNKSTTRPQAQLTSAAIGVSWAGYVEDWRKRVERIGNQNYPPEAKARNLYGSLELLVTIRADGALLDVSVLRSSGIPVLDAAAQQIVRLAAPYPPFPAKLAAEYGSLQVVRKWTFTAANQLAGS